MFFYVEIKNRVVKNIHKSTNQKSLEFLKSTPGLLLEDPEFDSTGDAICVVNITQGGKQAELVAFSDAIKAEDFFQKKAQSKFSNWDEYSADDVEVILENGVERSGDGSLCIFWANDLK